ncbi:hypothetical protein FB446DRAFT_811330 [Lentinula raphanica]|nr:hypothetical protein FB446DRAFT_811330 [Lentinula raphanica]
MAPFEKILENCGSTKLQNKHAHVILVVRQLNLLPEVFVPIIINWTRNNASELFLVPKYESTCAASYIECYTKSVTDLAASHADAGFISQQVLNLTHGIISQISLKKMIPKIIQDSLSDSNEAEDIAEIESGVDSAGIAEAKTRAAEPAAQSFHAQVLQRILEGIKAGLSRGQKSRPYRNRDIWMRPKHPAFALEEATTTGYTPLYESAVFYGSLICWSEMRMWKYKESCETNSMMILFLVEFITNASIISY